MNEVKKYKYPMNMPISVRDIRIILTAAKTHDNVGIRLWLDKIIAEFEQSGIVKVNSEEEYIAYLNFVDNR